MKKEYAIDKFNHLQENLELLELMPGEEVKHCINEDYDGHKIRRQNIASIVYDNPCTSIVYGNFAINEYGVVTTAFEEDINKTNIVEVKQWQDGK